METVFSRKKLIIYIFLLLSPAFLTALGARQKAPQEARQAEAAQINSQLEEFLLADARAIVTAKGVRIRLSDIQFIADSPELPESETAKLQEIVQILRNIPSRKILIAGHTATGGTEAEQREISLARARAVANYIVSQRARRAREIMIIGYGSDRPVASNATEHGMTANRRAEITIMEN